MVGIRRFSKSIRRLDNLKEDTEIEFPGILGVSFKGQQYTEVPNRDGYVYVRLRSNQNEVIQAYNGLVSPVYDLPVMVTRDKTFERFIIKGRDLGRYGNWGTSPYLPRHGAQHSFSDANYGGDIVWVYDRQFVPLSIGPSGSNGANNVIVNGDAVYMNNDWLYVGNTGTPDLFAYKPTGSSASLVMVYINEYGNPALLEGTSIGDPSLTGMNQIIPYLPTLPSTQGIPIGAVRLLSGTSAISWANIYDLRPLLAMTLGGGHTIQNEGSDLTQRTHLNFKGQIVWATDDAGNDASVISITGTHVIQSATQPSGTFPGMLWLQPA